MGDHDIRPTCLSSEPHDSAIRDHVLHYLGCIEICERETFYKDSNRIWEAEINHECGRLKKEGKSSEDASEGAKKLVKGKRQRWEEACKTELRRVDYLRATLSKDKDNKHLVEKLDESYKKWKESAEYREGLKEVRKWRRSLRGDANSDMGNGGERTHNNHRETLGEMSQTQKQQDHEEYDPEKDASVYIVQYENSEPKDEDDPRIKGRFPDQKTTIKILLEKGNNNLLCKDDSSKRIRYFHLPTNNMIWIEEAIARYFNQDRPDYAGIHRELQGIDKTETYMILRPQFWRGQQHGGRSAPSHTRHMRPLCETVSSDPTSVDKLPRNIVLFMPYLHWDTDRQRNRFAREIEDITEKHKDTKRQEEKEKKKERQEERKCLPKPKFKKKEGQKTVTWKFLSKGKQRFAGQNDPKQLYDANQQSLSNNNSQGPPEATSTQSQDGGAAQYPNEISHYQSHQRRRINTFGSLMKALSWGVEGLPIDVRGRVEIKNELGQYIIDAARLYEGMANYRDKKLLQKYLYEDPPLHPRRTLDQAYYWTLNTTKTRDRDQVVYRGTTARADTFHKYDPDKCEWPKHEELGITEGEWCHECRANIRKVSRIIMVDQLWMWILDEKTIITCFPKRYGANKNDSSGLHKSIRMRLQAARQNHIRSVFDLALIIIDECSNTFFDRAKTPDRQPQVIDAFSEAIGNVTNKQTAAFERLWHWTETASKVYHAKGKVDTSSLHIPLLDINPEGRLQREIKDILEELDIMIHINRTHRDVLKDYINHVEHILDPEGIFGFKQQHSVAYHTLIHLSKGSSAGPGHSSDDAQGKEADGKGDEAHRKVKDREIYEWFKINANELFSKVTGRIEELEELRKSAERTSNSLKDLLALKQQQASVVQAWQSVKQSEETVKQGRSIMMFTVVTIVFLPLSFMASIFGMNAVEFGAGDSWTLAEQFQLMFPISFGAIILTLILAFSTWARGVIWSSYKIFSTFFLIHTGLYIFWLRVDVPAEKIVKEAAELTDNLKNEVMKKEFENRRLKREQEEKKKEQEKRKNEGEIQAASTGVSFNSAREGYEMPVMSGANGLEQPKLERNAPRSRAVDITPRRQKLFSWSKHQQTPDPEGG